MSEKQKGSFISIFSKDNNSLVRNISNIKYKYMLFKSKDDGLYKKLFDSFDYIRNTDSCFFHVLDSDIGSVLYEALNNNQIDMNTIPEEIKTISFISVKKLKRVVFICFKTDMYYSITAANNYDKEKMLTNIYNIFRWLSENFSTETRKLNIDYKRFFKRYLNYNYLFFDSLLGSMYVSETIYEFTFSELEEIIDMMFEFCRSFNTVTLENMRRCLRNNSASFYYFLNKGIYIEELDECCLYNLPYHIMINIFKYVLDNTSFETPIDFFKRDPLKEEKSGNILFDKNLFDKDVSLIAETGNSAIYTSKSKGQYTATFMQVKDKAIFEEINITVQKLNSETLLRNILTITSEVDGLNYLVSYNDTNKTFTLSEYIKKYRNKENKITNLISLLNDWYFNVAQGKDTVYVKSGVSLLDVINIDQEENDFYFSSHENIVFSKEEGYENFDYSLCVMQVIKKYMELNKITTDGIYKCSFVKLFPSPFVQQLISYIDSEQYTSYGLIRCLKNCFKPDDISKIEFLEDLSSIELDLLQRITFCKNSDSIELVKNIKALKQKTVFAKSCEYISLDNRMNFVEENKSLTLSKKLLNKLTYCNNSSAFLIPEKVIVSKDVFDSQNYIVVGVIWNMNRLYTLDNLIKTKRVNTENIYNTVIRTIIEEYRKGYYADKLKDGMGSLLFDDNCNMYFDITTCNSYRNVCHNNTRELSAYYTSIVRKILNQFADYLTNFKFFTYDTLVDYCDHGDEDFEDAFDDIRFCAEHHKLYLSDDMCEECQKVYKAVALLGRTEVIHEIGKGIFYEVDEMYGLVWKPQLQTKKSLEYIADRVKIGIANGLYEKFVGLVPKKIIINNDTKNRKVLGIWYDDYEYNEKYIMELDSFKHAQKLKVVLMLYKKILPYIYDYSFIVPNKQVFSSMFIDKEYKGEIMIPDLPFIKCEVTVSEDQTLKEREKNKTLKMFSEFLYEYITSDERLNYEIQNNDIHISKIVEDILACKFTEEHIRNYLKNKDAYCKVHGVYFSFSDKLCPECIANGMSNKNSTILLKEVFDEIKETDDSQYEGGEATLYTNDYGQIYKLFNNTVNTSFKTKVIGKVFEKAKLFEEFNKKHQDIEFVLPDKVLYSYDNGVLNLEGYSQKFIEGSFKISSLKEKSFVQSQGYTKKDILEILIKVCKAIEFLHSIGVFIGDLNGGNILIKDKKVYIIDMDGMSYDDVRNCVYTDTYIYPPSAESKNITELDDWYSLAIQAFYYLTYSHPFRGICEDEKIPKNEVERMKYGYSVLGNHGIKQPAVSEGFGLMPKYLIKFFIETFEGKRRESMIEVLGSYLKSVERSNMEFKKIERQYSIAQEISENIYIDTDGQVRYNEELKCGVGNISSTKYENSHDCIALLGYRATAVINKKTGGCYFFNKVYDRIEYAYNNTIYYEGPDAYIIYVDELTPDGNIKTHKLQRQTENPVWVMAGNGDNKFVILEENMADNTYDIYCNSTKVCSFSQDDFLSEEFANILYDEISEKWVVYMSCNGKLKLVVIEKSGSYVQSTLDVKEIPDSASFYKNTIYFAGEGKIFMYNVNSQNLSSIDCNIATSESSIERIDNKLVISNDTESYMYIKS